MIESEIVRPWYKEFWAWFVLTPLIVVVFVGVTLVTFAVNNGDSVVVDDYYKVGKMINQEFEPERNAQDLGLQAELTIDVDSGELFVTLASEKTEALLIDRLELELSHPLKANMDKSLELKAISTGRYRADIDQFEATRWYLRLNAYNSDSSLLWRVKGELNLSHSHTSELNPL